MCSPYFPQTNFREEGEKKKKKQGFFLPPPIFTLLNLTAELFSVLPRGEVTDFFFNATVRYSYSRGDILLFYQLSD